MHRLILANSSNGQIVGHYHYNGKNWVYSGLKKAIKEKVSLDIEKDLLRRIVIEGTDIRRDKANIKRILAVWEQRNG